jgi:predicted transcriptional regulator
MSTQIHLTLSQDNHRKLQEIAALLADKSYDPQAVAEEALATVIFSQAIDEWHSLYCVIARLKHEEA